LPKPLLFPSSPCRLHVPQGFLGGSLLKTALPSCPLCFLVPKICNYDCKPTAVGRVIINAVSFCELGDPARGLVCTHRTPPPPHTCMHDYSHTCEGHQSFLRSGAVCACNRGLWMVDSMMVDDERQGTCRAVASVFSLPMHVLISGPRFRPSAEMAQAVG
jgi:hypothetical protein